MDDADSRWCAVCDRLILPSPTIVPNPPPSPEHVAPRNQGTRSSLIDGKTRIEIDQSPAPLYCSDKCRERVTEYSADSSSSDASDDSLKEHQLEYQHRPAPPRKSTPNTRSLAIVQREYGISSLPPRTSETHDELAPCKQPAPYKPPEYTSGAMMANRRLEAVLPKSLKPGERAPPLKPVSGWTDGSQAWRAATYSFSPPPRTRADILDPSRAAYISFVASPHRSTTSGVTASAASTTSSSSAPPSPTASSSVNSASLNSELLPSFDRLSRRTLLRKPRSFPQLTGILPRKSMRKTVIDDFEMIRVLGKARTGEVLLVKHKTTADLYALKASNKRRILAHEELQHWFTEQSVLKRMTIESTDPFVVNLWWSFLDTENLFLVMDFLPGGDLGTQLARWGLLGCDRARFYAAEIVEGVEGLHAAGVIYRNLKPENILIGGDGHIVLTGFGLAKEFPRRTAAMVSADGSTVAARPPWMKVEKGGELAAGIGQAAATTRTFCGTAEYLAPEIIQGLAYSYEVDWWSFGTMLYEMLVGVTPFWANNHPDMYTRVLQDELLFPDECTMDQDTRSLIRWLLERDPALRICEPGIKRHAYFSMIDWSDVYYKRYIPPYIPPAMDDDDQQEESDGSEEQGSEDEEGDILNAAPPLVPEKEPAPEVSPKVAKGVRSARQRHQKSGVPVLDRNLGENAEAEKADKKDEDDWDWDFVEVTKGKDRNGAKSTTLFARGVVDRYQLAAFREASTPSHRRGRAGTTFRKQTRQLSRPKSPSPSWFSSMSRLTGKRMSMSSSGEELDNLHALDRERSTDLSSVSARRPNLRKTRSNISTASSGRESSWLSGYSDAASDDSSLDSSGFSNSQGEWNGPSYDLHSHQLILKNLDLTGKIKPDRYPFESGDSADIYKGILNSSGSSISARSPFSNSGQYTTRKVAVKIFRRMHSDRESLERTSKSLYEEARIWRQLDHPNILPFLGIALDLGLSPALISPYCGSGPIMKYLQNHAKDPKEKLEMVIGVANGLAYLHSKQIIHGNLCTKVLIDADGLPVICGYGTSKTVGQPANSTSVFSAPIRFTSIRFTSPECLSAGNSAQTISADVYAFSMVMLEILSGLPPYHHLPTELAVYTHVLRGERPIRTHLDSQTVTSRIWQFLTSLWNEKPYLNTKMSDAAQDLMQIRDSDSDSDLDEDFHSASPESTHQSLRKETVNISTLVRFFFPSFICDFSRKETAPAEKKPGSGFDIQALSFPFPFQSNL
ncbi:kinase-like domain-containing protein [Mycena vulgaris]|nr:kinase-like domain-containing protein [Mycena vulgaris]